MAKMKDDTLLELLQRQEDASTAYTFGPLQESRERSYKDYFQQPYGNEEEGWSQLVTSDVADTVEWILPSLLDQFTSTEKVVEFEPSRASDSKGAEQATDAANYVFNKQNNGFVILYTAFKDALMVKTGAVHWYKQTKTVVEKNNLRSVPRLAIDLAIQEGWEAPDDDEIESLGLRPVIDPATGQPVVGPQGVVTQEVFNALMCRQIERKSIKVEAFPPENLQVERGWNSPMLDECPYVARHMLVTLSDLKERGFKVDAEDLAASSEPGRQVGDDYRSMRTGDYGSYDLNERKAELDVEDESQTTGWLRIEWVLADRDGDGIAERLEVMRLQDKILYVEECTQVPIATGSPILVNHQWDGMSIAETVADLQRLRTDIMRQTVNNALLANNPRATVITDSNGAPRANIDDLLDGRPGGVIRQYQQDAVGMQVTPFVGAQMFGMMEYIDQMREQRTGVSKQQQGLDPNALRPDRTAQEVVLTANAAQQRVKLIARIFAETIVKPIFKGILRLLTEGDMDRIAFRLRGEFVEFDPNEWRDEYDMTVNVGLGTGDKDRQLAVLNAEFQTQMGLLQSPLGQQMVQPIQVYNTRSKILDLAGLKNVGDYYTQPQPGPLQMPPAQPPYQVQIKQMELQADQQKFQAEAVKEQQKFQAEAALKQRELELQYKKEADNDQRDFEAKIIEGQQKERIELAKLENQRAIAIENNRTSIITARIAHPETQLTDLDIDPETGETFAKIDPIPAILGAVEQIAVHQASPKMIIRDSAGNVVGVQQGSQVQTVVRDGNGQVQGLQ